MKNRKVIYLIISLIFLLTLACRVREQVLTFLPNEPTPIDLVARFGTPIVPATSAAIIPSTYTLLPTVTSTPTLRPSPTPSRTPTKRSTPRPTRKPIPTPPPAKTLSPWPFYLKQRTDSDGQGTFQIRVKVMDGTGLLINSYQIKLTGTGLETPTIRYTGNGEPDGEVGFTPLGNICPDTFNGLYFVTVYSENTTGNNQLSANQEIVFNGCSGSKGRIEITFVK